MNGQTKTNGSSLLLVLMPMSRDSEFMKGNSQLPDVRLMNTKKQQTAFELVFQCSNWLLDASHGSNADPSFNGVKITGSANVGIILNHKAT